MAELSFMDIVQAELPPDEILAEGQYKLRIKRAEPKEYASGRTGWSVLFTVDDHPNHDGIFHNLMKPMDDDSGSTTKMFVRDLQAFAAAFGAASNDSADWIGNEGWAVVSSDIYQGTEKNVVKSFTAGK